MAITKELAIASIVITPATGAVRVEQVQRVLEDGHELASTPGPTVQLQPGDALDGLPPAVQASIAALWGQDWVQAHTRRVLDELAISQDGGAFLCTLNGAAEVSATAASMPTVDRARLGRNQAGNYLNGHLHTWDAYRRTVPVRERLELTA